MGEGETGRAALVSPSPYLPISLFRLLPARRRTVVSRLAGTRSRSPCASAERAIEVGGREAIVLVIPVMRHKAAAMACKGRILKGGIGQNNFPADHNGPSPCSALLQVEGSQFVTRVPLACYTTAPVGG